MKKLFALAVILLIFSSTLDAQKKIYLDENMEVTTRDKMEFYRETELKGKLTLIKDFYKNGTLQKRALASDATPGSEVYEGLVSTYNPEGKIQSTTTFSGGKRIGPAQTFDEKGRLLSDLVYNAEEDFSGKSYSYKDVEGSYFYNTITTFENAISSTTIVYDEDIKGIRYEIKVNNKGEYEHKYYGDKGKYIGTTYLDNSHQDVAVEYYENPMKVSKIQKYTSDGQIKESVIYSKNGKVLQEEKKNKTGGYKTTYDETGKKIGSLTYIYDKEADYYIPQNGEDIQFNSDISGFSISDVYENGVLILSKYFDINGKYYSEKVLKDEKIQEIRYYYPDGNLKSTLTYKSDMPYNGTFYDEGEQGTEQQYKEGVLVLLKSFRVDGKIKSEKKLNTQQTQYTTTVYDEKGTVIYAYTQSLEETDYFTAQIIQYENGKPGNKATVKNGVLQSGKIRYQYDSGLKELERSGKWILLKMYDSEGKLTQETKVIVDLEAKEGGRFDTIIQEDDLLYEL